MFTVFWFCIGLLVFRMNLSNIQQSFNISLSPVKYKYKLKRCSNKEVMYNNTVWSKEAHKANVSTKHYLKHFYQQVLSFKYCSHMINVQTVSVFVVEIVDASNITAFLTNGTAATLECSINNEVIIGYPAWYGPPITNDSRLKYSSSTGAFNPALGEKLNRLSWASNKRDLQLNPVTRIDEGEYECAANVNNVLKLVRILVHVRGTFCVDIIRRRVWKHILAVIDI